MSATQPVRIAGAKPSLQRIVLVTLAITPSGALSPGPLSAGAVAIGASMGLIGGLLVALGHMVVELPYLVVLYFFLEKLSGWLRRAEKPLSLGIALFIFYFALGLLTEGISILLSQQSTSIPSATTLLPNASPWIALVLGALLTGGNVYFLLWWLTVGLPLIRLAQENGAKGFTVMYASHVWMDYAWLGLLAAIGGLASLTSIGYALLLIVLGIVLVVFGADIAVKPYGKKLLPL